MTERLLSQFILFLFVVKNYFSNKKELFKMDTVNKAMRSKIMSRIGKRNTEPEMLLRKQLHRIGLRYRLHDHKLKGSPDIVFPKFKSVVFVHGCFWHCHGCRTNTIPKTNREFWLSKFERNMERDQMNISALLADGWRVLVVWECALKGKKSHPDSVARSVFDWLNSGIKMSYIDRSNVNGESNEGLPIVKIN